MAQPPPLKIATCPAGIQIEAGTKFFFIPFKTIEMLSLDKKTPEDKPEYWHFQIKTTKDTINLTSCTNLEADFKTICSLYRI